MLSPPSLAGSLPGTGAAPGLGVLGAPFGSCFNPPARPEDSPFLLSYMGSFFFPLLEKALAKRIMGSKQELTALIRGGKSSLTARVAALGLEVMAADS